MLRMDVVDTDVEVSRVPRIGRLCLYSASCLELEAMASGVRVDDGHIEGAKHAFMGHRVAGGQRARGPIWASTTARKLPCKETKARKSLAVIHDFACTINTIRYSLTGSLLQT